MQTENKIPKVYQFLYDQILWGDPISEEKNNAEHAAT